MRDIITTATVRLMQRTVEMGFTVENKASKRDEARKKLDRELGGL
jgi:hypothetical protein